MPAHRKAVTLLPVRDRGGAGQVIQIRDIHGSWTLFIHLPSYSSGFPGEPQRKQKSASRMTICKRMDTLPFF